MNYEKVRRYVSRSIKFILGCLREDTLTYHDRRIFSSYGCPACGLLIAQKRFKVVIDSIFLGGEVPRCLLSYFEDCFHS